MSATKHSAVVLIGLVALALAMIAAPSGCGPKQKKSNPQKLTRRAKTPPPYPEAKPVPLDAALMKQSRTILAESLHSDQPMIRGHAVECVRDALGTQGREEIVMALDDPSWQVRFSAAMSAGQLKLVEAKPKLYALLHKPFIQVKIASIYALHRLGDKRYSHELEQTARSNDPNVRSNTVIVLGMLDEPSAIKILRVMRADRSPSVRVLACESLWRLGNEDGLPDLVAATVSLHPDEQMSAFMGLAAPRDPRIIEHIRGGLTSDYPEVALVAARAMGILGSDEGYGVAMLGVKSSDTRQKVLAALAFAAIGRADAQPYLAPLLKDENADVRLNAASALLQLK
jgi:HEAT repeat protein